MLWNTSEWRHVSVLVAQIKFNWTICFENLFMPTIAKHNHGPYYRPFVRLVHRLITWTVFPCSPNDITVLYKRGPEAEPCVNWSVMLCCQITASHYLQNAWMILGDLRVLELDLCICLSIYRDSRYYLQHNLHGRRALPSGGDKWFE